MFLTLLIVQVGQISDAVCAPHPLQARALSLIFFATPGQGRERPYNCFLPNFGRPPIVVVRISRIVVSIEITRGAIVVVSITAKTHTNLSRPFFQPPLRGSEVSVLLLHLPRDGWIFIFSMNLSGRCAPFIPLAAGLRLLVALLGQTPHSCSPYKPHCC